MKPKIVRSVLAILIAMLVGALSAGEQEQPRGGLGELMRQKLKHSQSLIAGLAEEDFALIGDDARALRRLGEDALRRSSPNLTYLKYCGEFTSIAEELEPRAKEKDLNGATLSYVRLTINCVDCHKFVRDNRIPDQRPRAK